MASVRLIGPGGIWVGSQLKSGDGLPRVRAVGGRALHRARAAVALLDRARLATASGGDSGDPRPPRVRRRTRGDAGGVVDADVAEGLEEAGEVRPVGAPEGPDRLQPAQRLVQLGQRSAARAPVALGRADRLVAQRGRGDRRLGQVVGRARRAHGGGERLDGRARLGGERPQLGQERVEARGDGLGRLDERVDVVERGAQVDVGGVRPPHERGQLPDRVRELALVARDGAGGGGEAVDERLELVAPRRPGPSPAARSPRGTARSARESRLSSSNRPRRGDERRVEVAPAGVGGFARVAPLLARAADDPAQALARALVEDREELVDVDDALRALDRDHAALGDLGAAVGRDPQVDVAPSRAGQARQAQMDLGPLRAAGPGPRRPPSRSRPGRPR